MSNTVNNVESKSTSNTANNTVKKFGGFYWTEFKEEEAWLEAMAAEGLLFKERGILFTSFEKSEPRQRRYRIFQSCVFGMKKSELELIEECGWTCAEDTNARCIFYTDDPDVTEIITDRKGASAHFGRLVINAMIGILGALAIVYFYCRSILHFDDNAGRLHGMDMGIGWALYLGLGVVILCCYWLWGGIKELKYILRYKAGGLESAQPFRRCITVNKVRYGMLPVLFVMIFGAFAVLTSPIGEYYGQVAIDYPCEEFVPFSQVDGAVWEKIDKKSLETSDMDDLYSEGCKPGDAYIRVWDSAPTVLFVRNIEQEVEYATEKIEPEDRTYITRRPYVQSCYEARSEEIAEEYLKEEILYKDEYGEGDNWLEYTKLEDSYLEEIAFELDGVDYAGYDVEKEIGDEESPEDMTQNLYLRKGNKLMVVNYSGSENLKDKAKLFAEKL